jgi:succinate dehydrogenase / fumarate reductase iron-sulfur subunit
MFINGYPRLACNNQVLHIDESRIEIKPMPNFSIIRDLVPDLDDFFIKHWSVKPHLIRRELEELDQPTGEFFQSPEELMRYIQFAYCIKCGLCFSACPTSATDKHFLGPQALSQALRYNADSRDEGADQRAGAIYDRHGVVRCHFAGACSEVCPKGVDPAFAIQLLKGDMLMKKTRVRVNRGGAHVLPKTDEHVPNPDIPKAPEPTV